MAPTHLAQTSNSAMELIAQSWTVKLGLVIIATFAPVHALLITVGILIFADLFTGIWAAQKRKESITSSAMRRTVSKFAIYNLTICSGLLVERHALHDLVPVTKLLGGVIGLVEFLSLLENCNSILGNNVFTSLIQKLGSKNAEPQKKEEK